LLVLYYNIFFASIVNVQNIFGDLIKLCGQMISEEGYSMAEREEEPYSKSLLEEIIEKALSQTVDNGSSDIIPPSCQGSDVTKELKILFKGRMGDEKMPLTLILTVGLTLAENDLDVKNVAVQLKCDRSTAFRVLQRLQACGFAEKASDNHYTLSEKNCPLLYYLCRKRYISTKSHQVYP